jgi:CDP-glycerol glycerophosphotransferase (TagB/SpsB family)
MCDKYKNSYACINGKIITRENENEIIVRPYDKQLHRRCEKALVIEYLKIHSKYEIFGLFVRAIYWMFFSNVKLKNPTIILCDRRDRAGDNADAMFQYLNREHPDEYEYYFALTKKNEDWKRLQQYGKVIRFDSFRYMRLYWGGALIVSSYADMPIWMLFRGKGFDTYKDIAIVKKTIFLQHGVIKDDLSRLYNATSIPVSMFVTTTVPEYRSLLADSYGFVRGQVKLTGLPRYDLLENKPKKIITFMPTWRADLKGVHGLKPGFEKSAFYKILRKLLMEPEIANIGEKYGYTIQIMQHPMMELAKPYLDGKYDSRVKVLPYHTRYSDIFAQSSLIVTDYSSVAFDFAYLRKPVIYYQEEQKEFFSGSHNYTRGYFNYERDGFGEVITSKEELIFTLEEYMRHGCVVKQSYMERIENAFCFQDRNNCKRVYEEIKKIYP